jgi:hypothetical protein
MIDVDDTRSIIYSGKMMGIRVEDFPSNQSTTAKVNMEDILLLSASIDQVLSATSKATG